MTTSSKRFCVYIWHDPKNHIPRYVGKGLLSRPLQHLKKSSDTQISRLLLKRRSEGFILYPSIPASNLSENEAFEIEIRLIAEIGRQDLGLGPLFNRTNGGDGPAGRILSVEQRHRMSESIKRACNTVEWRVAQSTRRKEYFAKISDAKIKTGRASAARWNDPIFAEKHRRARMKPCTVGGSKIYDSYSSLVADLGYGKSGARSKSFRYV